VAYSTMVMDKVLHPGHFSWTKSKPVAHVAYINHDVQSLMVYLHQTPV